MNIKHAISKYIISANTLITLSAIFALTSSACWGAADKPMTPMGPAGEPITPAGARMAAAMADAARRGDGTRVNQLAPMAIAMNAPFDDLPNETIEQIASYLDEKSLKQLAQVSKRFNQIAMNIPLYQDYLIRKYTDELGSPYAALFNAINSDNLPLVQRLIKQGVDINKVSKFSYSATRTTPLLQAIFNGDKDVVIALLHGGANPNLSVNDMIMNNRHTMGRTNWGQYGPSPLHLAIETHYPIQFIYPAPEHSTEKEKIAFYRNKKAELRTEIVSALLAAGAQADRSFLELVIKNVSNGCAAIVNKLLQAGVAPHEDTLILAAAQASQHPENEDYKATVDLLISAGVDVNTTLKKAIDNFAAYTWNKSISSMAWNSSPSQFINNDRDAAKFLLGYGGAHTSTLTQNQLKTLNSMFPTTGAPGALKNAEKLQALFEQERTNKETQTWYGEAEAVLIARKEFEAARKLAVAWAVQQVQKISPDEVRMALELARSQLTDAQAAAAGVAGRALGWASGWTAEQIEQADLQVVEAQHAVDVLQQASQAAQELSGPTD